ncbi:MAG: lysoplasmalogenase family protein [Lewinella sp.]|nr:lysoplasmalogenase family protein [Lewinella sp.]
MATSLKYLTVLFFWAPLRQFRLTIKGCHELYEVFKPLTTVLITLIPTLYGWRAPKMYWSLTVAGLLLCLIGDIFLPDGENFVFGLASFLTAHILFTVSFVSVDKVKHYVKAAE